MSTCQGPRQARRVYPLRTAAGGLRVRLQNKRLPLPTAELKEMSKGQARLRNSDVQVPYRFPVSDATHSVGGCSVAACVPDKAAGLDQHVRTDSHCWSVSDAQRAHSSRSVGTWRDLGKSGNCPQLATLCLQVEFLVSRSW